MEKIMDISRTSLVILIVVIIVAFTLLYLRIETSDQKDREFRILLTEQKQSQQLQNFTLDKVGEQSLLNHETLRILETRFSEEFLNETLQNFEEQHLTLEKLDQIITILNNSGDLTNGND